MVVTLSAPEKLSFNITLDKPFSASDPLQSILISKPAFINSTAATLATLVGGNATNTQLVCNLFRVCARPPFGLGMPEFRRSTQGEGCHMKTTD